MISAIDGFLKPLDWRMRLAVAASFAALGVGSMSYGLRLASLGPWILAVLCGTLCAGCVWMSQRAWPSLPGPAGTLADRWKTARGKATKSGSGRFMWNLGRIAVGWYVASVAIDRVPGAGGELTWLAGIGFAVSYGMFGLESALWGMLAVAVVSHAAASYGLGLDLSDPVERRAFTEAWRSGATISWFWAFALASSPLAWIGISAAIGRTKKALARSIKRRRDDAVAQRRIDARRARLSGSAPTGGETALDKARARLEEAKGRLRSFDKGGAATFDGDGGGPSFVEAEMTGVEKLENDNLVATLRDYVAQVARNKQSEAQGVDWDTPGRRGFDRVILALGDAAIDLMRRDRTGQYKDLLEYYLSLCEGESRVARGGDGEMVTSVSVARAFDEEDEIDGMSGDAWNVHAPPSDEIGSLGDVMDDEEEVDVPPPSEWRRDEAPPEPARVQAETAEPSRDDGPEGAREIPFPTGGPLLLEDDVDEENTSTMHQESVARPEAVEHDRDEDADRGGDAPSEPVEPMPAAVVEGGTVDEAGVRRADGGEQEDRLDGPPEPHDAEAATADATPRQSDVDPVAERTGSVGHVDQGGATEADPARAEGADASASRSDAAPKAPLEEDVTVPPSASASELKAAAMRVLLRRTPRDMVVSTAGWFSSTADLASAMGVDDEDLSEPFEEYWVKVEAFAAENGLRELISRIVEDEAGDDEADAIDSSVAALVGMGWDHDAELVERASADALRIRRAAASRREAAEEARRVEEERRAEELRAEEARAQAERDRAEEERRTAEREAAEERRRAEQEAAEEADRVAAEQKAKALEARRGKIAIQILLGRLTDAVVEDAIDLFDSAESLAQELEIDLETAQDRYDAFAAARDARLKYRELLAAFRAEDVAAIEALLKDESSFEGYTPTEIPIVDIRKWAEGVRVRERLDGLVDGNRDVVETGSVTRRRFMMKRTGVTDALAAVVDEEIPRELRTAKGLRDAMKNMGEHVPPSLLTLLQEAEGRAAALARGLVDLTDTRMKIGEYASAFLPSDVRIDGEDAWEMLVRMAASAPAAAATDVAEEASEQAAADPVTPPPPPAASAPPEPSQVPEDRIRMSAPIGFKGARSYEEVAALNAEKEVKKLPTGTFDMNRFFNQQRIALRGYLGERTDELVKLEDGLVYVSVPRPDGSIMGRVRVQARSLAFAWYEHPDAVWFKDVLSGEIKKLMVLSVERQATPFMNDPNGDPENVIGNVLMSAIVSADGLTSVGPFVERMGPRYAIMSVNDSDGIRSFMSRIASL